MRKHFKVKLSTKTRIETRATGPLTTGNIG